MPEMLDLETLKSKDFDTCRATIDSFVAAIGPSIVQSLRDVLSADGLTDAERESGERIMLYALFAIYASDIASIPDQLSRERFLPGLRRLVDVYKLNYDRVIYFTRFETGFSREISRALATTESM